MRYVLDADLLIGALDASDAHHAEARRLLTGWRAHGDTVLISVINLSEAFVAPASDPQLLRLARSAIAALGVTVDRPSQAIAVDAARLRSRHPISLPDAYLLASARHLDATVASFDTRIVRTANAERIAAHHA